MNKLLIAALMTATLGSAAQAATTPQDQAWIVRMTSAVNDTLSQSTESIPKVGVVYVPMTVDAKGHAQVAAAPQSCGCPDLDQAAIDALNSMTTAPRPPADLVGQRFMVKVVFKAPPSSHGDLSRTAYAQCG